MENIAWVIGVLGALYLILKFPRKSLIFLGILTSACVLIGGITWGIIWLFQYAEEYKKNKVSAVIEFNTEECSDEYPLLIGIKNESNSTIDKTYFRVKGRIEGFSDPIYANSFLNLYSTDRIIHGSEAYFSCWRIPEQSAGASSERIKANPPGTLVWSVVSVEPRFVSK